MQLIGGRKAEARILVEIAYAPPPLLPGDLDAEQAALIERVESLACIDAVTQQKDERHDGEADRNQDRAQQSLLASWQQATHGSLQLGRSSSQITQRWLAGSLSPG